MLKVRSMLTSRWTINGNFYDIIFEFIHENWGSTEIIHAYGLATKVRLVEKQLCIISQKTIATHRPLKASKVFAKLQYNENIKNTLSQTILKLYY